MIDLKRILVPTDFSDFSQVALRYGCEFAAKFDADLHLLHVIDNPAPPAAEDWGKTLDEYRRDLETYAGKEMQLLDLNPLPDRTHVVDTIRYGSTLLEIIRHARENEIDLIVLGTHGRTGLAHVFLGSVAEKVVRKSPCPVLTVRHPEHEFVHP